MCTPQVKGDDIALLTTPKHKQQQQHVGSLSRPSSVRGFFAGLFKDKEKGGSGSATNSSSRHSTGNDDSTGTATGVTIGRRLSASAHTATAAVSLVSAPLLLWCSVLKSRCTFNRFVPPQLLHQLCLLVLKDPANSADTPVAALLRALSFYLAPTVCLLMFTDMPQRTVHPYAHCCNFVEQDGTLHSINDNGTITTATDTATAAADKRYSRTNSSSSNSSGRQQALSLLTGLHSQLQTLQEQLVASEKQRAQVLATVHAFVITECNA
jgi:hypothetical protein